MAGTIERTLALKLIGDVRGLKKAERGLGSFTKSAISWGKALGGALVLGGIEKVVTGLGDAFKGFKSGQRVAAQLRKTWRNLGMEGKAYGRTLDTITQSTLRLGTSDDEAVAAFTRSLQRTKDYERSLKELTIAQDLVANGSAPNLNSAMNLIQQAAKGSYRVVDRFGLSSETAAGRVNELGRQVRGAAKEKARLDPFGVLFNRIAEDAETIVGSFVSGDFSGFVKGLEGLGKTVDEALFGRTGRGPNRKRVPGLVDKFGSWGKKIADGIAAEFGKVDWGKVLGDALNAGVTALSTAKDNGTLSTLAIIGTAIAGGIFAVDLFVTAASAMFRAPRWALGAGAKAAGAAVGKAFRIAMFLSEAAVSLFASATAGVMAKISAAKVVTRAADSAGKSLGGVLVKGVVAGMTGAVAVKAVADGLFSLTKAGELDWTERAGLPDSPFKWPWSQGGFFFPDENAVGTAGARRGWSWVGERGPELVKFRGGEKVMDNRSSMAMAGGSIVVNVTVNAPVAADGARVGQEIAHYLDQHFARGGRFRYAPVGGNR